MLGTGDAEDIQAKELLEELSADDDTGGEYDELQPVDSYEDDQAEAVESTIKHGVLSHESGEIVGGVSTPPTPDPPLVA
jgi:hypothetical protein